MSARFHAMVRLLAVQSAWTYERMLGIGVGYASAPFLEEVCVDRDQNECHAIVARSAEFFNSHPYLAGVAVGAMVRAERDRVPGEVILRLRTALSGPLGALGDQLVWAGEVPVLIGLGLSAVPWIDGWAVLLVVIVHNLLRVRLTAWGLDLGLSEGLNVGSAIQRSWLPRVAAEAQRMAAFAMGLAIPVIAAWLLADAGTRDTGVVVALAIVGLGLGYLRLPRLRVSGLHFGLVLLLVTLLLVGEFQ